MRSQPSPFTSMLHSKCQDHMPDLRYPLHDVRQATEDGCCVQLYLALSAVLASGGQQPLTALQEADAELASLAPDTAKTKVAFPPAH